MSTGKKILSVILIAVMAFGFGVAGGLLADEIKAKFAGDKTGTDAQEGLLNINNAHFQGDGGTTSYTADSAGNIVINVSEDYSLAEVIAEKAMPSVVSVQTVYETSFSASSIYDYFWGYGNGRDGKTYTQEASCVGTGFIVDSNGYILTNSHVVNDGDYKTINISLYDGDEIEGKVLWNDSTLDLAIVKIDKTGLVPAELGDSDGVKIGSYAAAIGNPLGLTFERSMSQGIISGLNRTITVSSSLYSGGTTMEGLLQTDAAINSGNSGGPLLNAKGQVIGIASAKASDGESMGFAIPINVAKPIIQQIKETGSYERVYLGITAIGLEQITDYSAKTLEEHYGSSVGIYVASVTKGGGAEKAGLEEGDVILKVNGTSVGTMNKMYSLLVDKKSGDTIEVTYLRNKTERTAIITLMTAEELSPSGE